MPCQPSRCIQRISLCGPSSSPHQWRRTRISRCVRRLRLTRTRHGRGQSRRHGRCARTRSTCPLHQPATWALVSRNPANFRLIRYRPVGRHIRPPTRHHRPLALVQVPAPQIGGHHERHRIAAAERLVPTGHLRRLARALRASPAVKTKLAEPAPRRPRMQAVPPPHTPGRCQISSSRRAVPGTTEADRHSRAATTRRRGVRPHLGRVVHRSPENPSSISGSPPAGPSLTPRRTGRSMPTPRCG